VTRVASRRRGWRRNTPTPATRTIDPLAEFVGRGGHGAQHGRVTGRGGGAATAKRGREGAIQNNGAGT